eukprot:10028-Heterococcus_DN1.PRE.2
MFMCLTCDTSLASSADSAASACACHALMPCDISSHAMTVTCVRSCAEQPVQHMVVVHGCLSSALLPHYSLHDAYSVHQSTLSSVTDTSTAILTIGICSHAHAKPVHSTIHSQTKRSYCYPRYGSAALVKLHHSNTLSKHAALTIQSCCLASSNYQRIVQ